MRQKLLLILFPIVGVIAGSSDSVAGVHSGAPGQIAIDYVTYYKETNEVTVELFYLKEYTEESAEKMRQAAQEIVYDQSEVKRMRVPAPLQKLTST
ncbi:MAG: hypothetical protein HC859_07580 [Bacteroidia bacterium]|nr:hypothetical protein [Bacteroidia bacterium]